jgi:methylated-DNA-[protein]-cysteine S-methyltransferase
MSGFGYVQRTYESPVGAVLWPADNAPGTRARVPLAPTIEGDTPILAEAARQFDEYFAGNQQRFDLPLDPCGTPFQVEAWLALATIPYGSTASYTDQAVRLGRPQAVRAVGAANGRNPLSIVLPCHRVVGASGSLTGFAGGLATKRWLLDFEQGETV